MITLNHAVAAAMVDGYTRAARLTTSLPEQDYLTDRAERLRKSCRSRDGEGTSAGRGSWARNSLIRATEVISVSRPYYAAAGNAPGGWAARRVLGPVQGWLGPSS
jgi:hypothetical protein